MLNIIRWNEWKLIILEHVHEPIFISAEKKSRTTNAHSFILTEILYLTDAWFNVFHLYPPTEKFGEYNDEPVVRPSFVYPFVCPFTFSCPLNNLKNARNILMCRTGHGEV